MFVQMDCIVVDASAENRRELTAALASLGVTVVAQAGSIEELTGALARTPGAHLCVVNLDPGPSETLRKLESLPRAYAQVSFLVFSATLDPNLLIEVMRAGVKEFVTVPISPAKFADSLERIASSHGLGRKGRIIHVIPTVGGCGSTTVACNVAASLAAAGRTALVDMDLARGGVASYFDLRPRFSIADVMESSDKFDRQLVDNALAVHDRSKLAVLARPDLPEDTQRVTPAGLTRLLGVLSRSYDHIIIDSLMSVDPVYKAAITSADLNILVMQLNVPSARNAERFIGALRRLGVESSRVRVVVNRFVKKGWDIEPGEVEKALGLRISWMVPNDFKSAIEAMNFGEPVVLRSPKAEISASLSGLAQELQRKAA